MFHILPFVDFFSFRYVYPKWVRYWHFQKHNAFLFAKARGKLCRFQKFYFNEKALNILDSKIRKLLCTNWENFNGIKLANGYKHHIYPSFNHPFDVLIVIIIYFCLAHIYVYELLWAHTIDWDQILTDDVMHSGEVSVWNRIWLQKKLIFEYAQRPTVLGWESFSSEWF